MPETYHYELHERRWLTATLALIAWICKHTGWMPSDRTLHRLMLAGTRRTPVNRNPRRPA